VVPVESFRKESRPGGAAFPLDFRVPFQRMLGESGWMGGGLLGCWDAGPGLAKSRQPSGL